MNEIDLISLFKIVRPIARTNLTTMQGTDSNGDSVTNGTWHGREREVIMTPL
ncbi:MAG: hypothetical protein HXY35_11420 [Chloroflexi bacterium]|nr:hypothetical protein [Chloroflexota bacterium]